MRSSKQRSRNKNRNRSVGNNINRVFDSSGPEGKVRGTPQQIIEKYNQLARDAQLSNDRVAAENFQQHAEHYLRMLSEATREQDQRREEQEQRREEQERQNRERQAERDRSRPEQRQEPETNTTPEDPAESPQPDVIDASGGEESGLVETPETAEKPKPKRAPRPRKPRAKKPDPETTGEAAEPASQDTSESTPDAAE
ncbi:protein of unknown function [Poseidonocella pacifica]|uniref:DUF4167 domain-containing protein n=1 Tax=Poseidonocella pacifica TaxID=871651 RepID=A0A1I0VA74_9RHOB|nr:DUF4167 domain-containing protein [Poseidonocella pacifica]SFA73251.1 protein of unknown function [Poseidonocella pacifica]